MSDVVRNPKDRYSCDMVHLIFKKLFLLPDTGPGVNEKPKMSGTQMYMLAIRLSAGSELGIDVPKMINQVNSLLGDYAKATKCLYKFKVCCLFRFL